ncbi:MAG TPA: DUF3788 family protein [Terracidiphilus sp.]|nr:DUF3788 family protein [Terracidiphilus sp.]
MEYINAFKGRENRPSDAEIADALGPTVNLWNEFIKWMADEEGVTEQEWKGIVVKKYGWSLRLKQKSRNIAYLGPGRGCFMVSFVVSDKALQATKEAHLPKAVAELVAIAPHYPEGNGLRLIVQGAADMPAIRKIAAIKLAC